MVVVGIREFVEDGDTDDAIGVEVSFNLSLEGSDLERLEVLNVVESSVDGEGIEGDVVLLLSVCGKQLEARGDGVCRLL